MANKDTSIKLKDRKLNQGQLGVLLKLYRYRFGTRELIATSLGKKNSTSIYSRLDILKENGYIASKYEKSYKLSGKPASYYLLPKGLRSLQQYTHRDDITDTAIKNSYRDNYETVTDQFIDSNLAVYAISNQLQALYPAIKQFTKRELVIYKYFPKRLPDLYLSLNVKNDTRRYFLDLIKTTDKPFAINWQLGLLANYFQNGQWQAKGNPFPVIMYVCETGELEKRIRKQVNAAVYKFGVEIQFYTSTQNALMYSTQNDDAIWSSVEEPDKLIALKEI